MANGGGYTRRRRHAHCELTLERSARGSYCRRAPYRRRYRNLCTAADTISPQDLQTMKLSAKILTFIRGTVFALFAVCEVY